ncbi:MAG TPA: methyl-accepting chemotaxis protein [Patescibacteria group bacterium]|nr:methyl-accepting chemotaxis protein [Patescibacteria group bacterium]
MLKNLSITAKFALVVAIAAFGIIAEMAISWHGEAVSHRFGAMRNTTDQIALSILTLRRHEKDFLLRNDLHYSESWKTEASHLAELVSSLDAAAKSEDIATDTATAPLSAAVHDYETTFLTLVAQQVKAGLTPDTGLQGDLRNAVHTAEKSLVEIGNDSVTKDMLMLRRHEKDFLLRRDEKYVTEFEDAFKVMQAAKLDAAVARDMDTYRSSFLEMVRAMKTMGLTPEAGLQGDMRAAVHRTEDSLTQLSAVTQEAIAASQSRQHAIGLGLGVAVSLAALLASILIAKEVIGPIGTLTAITNLLAGGNTAIVIGGIDRKDEIGPLAQALEQWRVGLVEADARRRHDHAERALRDARQHRIEDATSRFETQIVAMLGKIKAAVEHLHTSADTLSANAEQTQRQSAAVSAATDQATANVQTVSAASSELAASINEISRQVSQSAMTSRAATDEAAEATKKISGLANSAHKIGEVVSLINDIAAQTNLLALNATIESARAGDAGKGFAVVANEVKHLAGQTGRATDDIANQVSSVQDETKATVSAIEGIARTIAQIAELSTAIASAVEEQGAATAEIAHSVEQASRGTREVASNISGVARTAAETGHMAQIVFESANDLMQESQTLEQAVKMFLIDMRTE